MTAFLILLALLLILVTIWYIRYFKYDRYLKQFTGPPSLLPILGHSLHFRSLKDLLPISMKFQKEYGPSVKFYIAFFPPFLQVADPKLLEGILSSTKLLDKGNEYTFLHRWLGTGLLTSGPTKWKKHRKILTPAFHFQILQQFTDTFNVHADILVERMRIDQAKPSIDIYPYITLCALDIICATSMGTTINAQKDGTSEYVKCVKEMSRLAMERTISFVFETIFLYSFTSNYRAEMRALKVLHGHTNSVIASRKREMENNKDFVKGDDSDVGIKKRRSFLDLLLQYKLDGGDITDEEIRQEVDTFMFEGHDTISTAISFALFCLANNPDAQKSAVEELTTIFSDNKNRSTTSKDLQEMKYLEMVIKETLRLYPSVPLYTRDVVEDTKYDGGVFPKKLTLGIFAYAVHRNPKIYPDPEKFDPERFSPECQADRSPYAYIPFSAGSRNCIGQRFAMLEMKAVISKVLREFELLPATPEHKLILVQELVLKSRSGIRICFKKRNF